MTVYVPAVSVSEYGRDVGTYGSYWSAGFLLDLFPLGCISADWEDSLFILAISLDLDFSTFGLDFRCCLGITSTNYYKFQYEEPFLSHSMDAL